MDIQEIKKIIKKITFENSCIDMGYKFQIKETQEGFLIRSSFKRPDTHTGKVGIGYGRWMFVDKNCDERGIVMTAWVCVELIVKHELMEAFKFSGIRILDPHKSLNDLAFPHVISKLK